MFIFKPIYRPPPLLKNIEKIYIDEFDGTAEIDATALSVIKDTIYKTL